MDIEDKILQRKEMAHLFKWYYPEGGWGWIVLCAAMFSQALCQGVLQLGFSYPLGIIIRKSFKLGQYDKKYDFMSLGDSDTTVVTGNAPYVRGLGVINVANSTERSMENSHAGPDNRITQLHIGRCVYFYIKGNDVNEIFRISNTQYRRSS